MIFVLGLLIIVLTSISNVLLEQYARKHWSFTFYSRLMPILAAMLWLGGFFIALSVCRLLLRVMP